MPGRIHFLATMFLLSFTIGGSFIWFMTPPLITKAEKVEEIPHKEERKGHHVLVSLEHMQVLLMSGEEVLETLPIVSVGKPGSYYETIGGKHIIDYKTPLHFSSIGHVYMPHSVHIFGNYFIHGIPYYPNGNKVSSEYSGGCIRLADVDAKKVYAFVEKGTPITISKNVTIAYEDTTSAESNMVSQEITNYMTATISLEVLTQDNQIFDGRTTTTRKKLLPRLIQEGDVAVSLVYARSLGEETFIALMNEKAKSLGMTNTRFTSVTSPVETTYEDYTRFRTYINDHKSYLLTLSTPSL